MAEGEGQREGQIQNVALTSDANSQLADYDDEKQFSRRSPTLQSRTADFGGVLLILRLCNFDQPQWKTGWQNTEIPNRGRVVRSQEISGEPMWTFTNHSKELAHSVVHLESVISERTGQLQKLSQRLLKVQDDERRKLARDLHHTTAQTMAALTLSVSFLQEKCKQDPSILALSSDVTRLADQAVEEIRTMSYLLHPPLLDEVGFACAAEWYVDGFAKRSGIRVRLNLANGRERLPMEVEIALFRVLQESLTNVHRHSGASQVEVRFLNQPERVVLEIQDFGRGIPAEQLARLLGGAQSGVGLAGMRERLHEFNGQLEIESDNQGTIVRATVPHPAITRLAFTEDCGRDSVLACVDAYS